MSDAKKKAKLSSPGSGGGTGERKGRDRDNGNDGDNDNELGDRPRKFPRKDDNHSNDKSPHRRDSSGTPSKRSFVMVCIYHINS